MSTVQVRARHLGSGRVQAEVARWNLSERRISDRAAVTIAAWWQSPGGVGHVLASFASGVAVERGDLADDIERTLFFASESPAYEDTDLSELVALQAWAQDTEEGS